MSQEQRFDFDSSKVFSEAPVMQTVPQLPQLFNSFAPPNELTIFSSKEVSSNLKSKSSSNIISVKSKSHYTRNSVFNNQKSSCVSSLNLLPCSKSKSSSFSRKFPELTLANAASNHPLIYRTFDYIRKTAENYAPSIYYSLSHFRNADSPISGHNSLLSLKSLNNNKHRDTKTIRRNLLIYSTSKEKRSIAGVKQTRSSMFDSKSQKLFSNQQNQILKDLVFFEEGLAKQKKNKKKRTTTKNFLTILHSVSVNFWDLFKTKSLTTLGVLGILCKKMIFESGRLVWDQMMLLMLGFYFFWIPIELAFRLKMIPIYLFTITSVCLLLDVCKKGMIHSSKKKNKSKFPKKKIVQETFSLVFLGLFLFDVYENLKLFYGLAFLIIKIFQVQKNINKLQNATKRKKRFSFLLGVLLLLIRIYFFSNLTACIWIYIGFSHKQQNLSWLSNIMDSTSSHLELYFRALSVNLTNVTFVGLGMTQGLIVPTNTLEYCYNSLVTVFGFLFVWHNFRAFKSFFSKEDEEEKVNIKEFERILKHYGLDYNERMGFTRELGLVLGKNREQKLFGDLLRMMSPSYQESLLMRIYWPIIKRIPVLSKNFSKAFLVKLLQKINIIAITPNETLFKQGDYGEECLYYVLNGEIECYLRMDEKNSLKLRTVGSNEYFREFSFFSSQVERFTAKSLTFSSILKIELRDFISVLKDFPLDHENYFSIKEKINTYNNRCPLFLVCEGCQLKNHQIFDCPNLTYCPKKAYIYQEFISSFNQIERRIYQRKKSKVCHNALSKLKEIENRLLDFQYKYQEEINCALEEIYPSTDNENSDSNQINENEGKFSNEYRSLESKESKNPTDFVTRGKEEEFFGNPPSIFLQSPSKKSRKSMTESIFHETNELKENNEDSEESNIITNNLSSKHAKESKTDNTINDSDLKNENDDEEECDGYESDKKETNKPHSTSNVNIMESARMSTNQVNTNPNLQWQTQSLKGVRTYQKFFSDRESKILSEKDTFHVLQNFEKMNKVVNPNNFQYAQTLQTAGSGKKRSIVGSYSNSKSNSSSFKRPGALGKSALSSHSNTNSTNLNGGFFSTHNKKTKHSDYLSRPLFSFEFDKPKEFKGFLPHNNLGKVMKRVEIDGLLKSVRVAKIRYNDEEETEKKKSLKTSNAGHTSLTSKVKEDKEMTD